MNDPDKAEARPLHLDDVLLLTASEAAALRETLPADWTPSDLFQQLERNEEADLEDVYILFDNELREEVAHAADLARVPGDFDTSLLDLALGRIEEGFGVTAMDVYGPPDVDAQDIGPFAVAVGLVELYGHALASHAGMSERQIEAVLKAPDEWLVDDPESSDALGPPAALAGLVSARARAMQAALEVPRTPLALPATAELSWGGMPNLRVFHASWAGRILGLVYWAEPIPAHTIEGEPVITEAGWALIYSDSPNAHDAIETPGIEVGMDEQEIRDAVFAALDRAEVMLRDRYGT